MKKTVIAILIFILTYGSYGQINQYGYPLYTYYDSKDYNANDQFWDIVEDENGLIYAANNSDGILQFDGVTWRKIQIEGNPAVRCLAFDNDGVLYAGCAGDFGYVVPNIQGNLQFVSLINKYISDSTILYSYVFKVNIIRDTVFFSTDNSLLFKYNKKVDTVFMKNLPQYSLFTFAINDKLFGGGYLNGLYQCYADSVRLVKNGEFYKSKNIFSILPDNDKVKIITGKQGIYNYDPQTGKSVQQLQSSAIDYLKEYITYSATSLSNTTLLATIGSGVVVCSNNGTINEIYDEQIGIKDHVCADIDNFNNSAWGALSIGLVKFEQNSPFRKFTKQSNLEGFILDITEFEDKLVVATELGLYYLNENRTKPSSFISIKGIDAQITSICKVSPQNNSSEFLLVGTMDGIYRLSELNMPVELIDKKLVGIDKLWNVDKKMIEDQDKTFNISAKSLFFDKKDNIIWVGSTLRLFGLQYKNNKYQITNHIYNIGDAIKNITQDNFGNVWASTNKRGLVFFDKNTHKFNNYSADQGLPFNHGLRVYNFNNQVICSSQQGLYLFDNSNDTFIHDTIILNAFGDNGMGIRYLESDSDNAIYMNYFTDESKGLCKIVFNDTLKKFEIIRDFNRLGNNIEVDCFYEYKNAIWFGVSDELYSYNKSTTINYNLPYKCLVRKVEGPDSVYFYGAYYKNTDKGLVSSGIQHDHQKPILKYANNDITFHFAAPYFEGVEAIEYSYKLAGFKTEWSKWNKEPKAVFTNLNEGKYTFQVKAKNIYNIESEVGQYEFTILPPWYRTIVAFLVYFIALIVLIWVILKLYTRRLLQEKIRLEGIVQERTAEIREQRDEIAGQKQSIEDSIQYASRIQKAILPSDELTDEILPEHFILFRPRDIVSGDYYWANRINGKTVIVAADCTGHGVPGAFMSMLGVSFLNAIVMQERVEEPHLILNKLRERVKRTLKQEGKEGEAKDGMDIALVVIDDQKKKLYYAGAYNPVLIYRHGELHEIKADRMPIGIYVREKESFTLNEFDYQNGDTFYIFSDGFPDQFGGEKGQKFRIKAMKQLLVEIQDKPMDEQKEFLNKTIEDWMGCEYEQIDDMVVVGVRL